MMASKIITLAASVVEQNKMNRVRVSGRWVVRKASHVLHQPTFQAASPTCLLHVWRGGRGQRRVIVLQVMSHTFGKAIPDCCLATGMFSPTQEKSWNWQKSQRNIISILLEYFYQKTWFWNHRFGWSGKAFLFSTDPSNAAQADMGIITSPQLSDSVFDLIP